MMPSLYVPMLHPKEIHDCLALISFISIMSKKNKYFSYQVLSDDVELIDYR